MSYSKEEQLDICRRVYNNEISRKQIDIPSSTDEYESVTREELCRHCGYAALKKMH